MKKTPSGVALLSTLLLSIVLMFLLGAFLTINRDALSNASDYAGDPKVRQAALSGVEYARGRLIEVPEWGVPTGTASAHWVKVLNQPSLVVWEREQGGLVHVVGVMGESGFQIYFQSELEDTQDFPIFSERSVLAAPDDPSSWDVGPTVSGRWLSTSRFTSPAGVVTSPKSGLRPVSARTANVQVLGFSAGQQQWLDTTLRKPTPVDFSLCGNGKVGVGLLESGVWSILSNDPYVNEVAASDDFITPDVITSSSNQSVTFGPDGGRLLAGNQVDLVRSLAIDSLSPLATKQSGSSAVIGDGYEDDLESESVKSATGGEFLANQTIPFVSSVARKSVDTNVGPVELDSGRYKFTAEDTVDHYDINSNFVRTHVGSIGTDIRLEQGQMKVLPGRSVAVSGDFKLEKSATYNKTVYLALGDENDPSHFKVNGKTDLQGAIVGNGSFTGVDDVVLQSKSATSAPNDFGVCLHAQTDLRIQPVNFAASNSTAETVDEDGEFKGMVFVGGNLVIRMGNNDFQTVGSLVSEHDIFFDGVTNLTSTYDPAQVDKFTEHFDVTTSETLSVDIVYQSFHR